MTKRIGSIHRTPIPALAADAAVWLCALRHPTRHVVTLDPVTGVVAIEPMRDAAESDIVGAYDPDNYPPPRWIGLDFAIREDLQCEVESLRVRGKAGRIKATKAVAR